MSLKRRINEDYMEAFRAKDQAKKAILSTLKGEIQTAEKNSGSTDLDDEATMKILAKSAKSLRESIDAGDEESKVQLEVVSGYMPKQMTKDEISEEIRTLRSGPDQLTIGAVMKHFGRLNADRKLVAEVFNSIVA